MVVKSRPSVELVELAELYSIERSAFPFHTTGSPSDRSNLTAQRRFPLTFPPTRSMDGGAMIFDHERPYFNMSVAACRRAGATGGRRSAWNRKLRQINQPPASGEDVEFHLETPREAIELLDRQLPWLRGAEGRGAR